MKWLKDLWFGMNYTDGNFSHTKLWSNVAYATATLVIIKLTFMSQLNENYFMIYLGVVAAHGTASKFLNIKAASDINKEK